TIARFWAIVDFSEIYQNTSKYNVKHITRR
ncbi:hypothetical protein, partial [Klebsiella pneumoniae]